MADPMTPERIADDKARQQLIRKVEKLAQPPEELSVIERVAWLRGHLHGCRDTLRVVDSPSAGTPAHTAAQD